MSMFNLVVDDTMNGYLEVENPQLVQRCECEHNHCQCVEPKHQHAAIHIALNPESHTTYVWQAESEIAEMQ